MVVLARKLLVVAFLFVVVFAAGQTVCYAHFGMIIPSQDIVENQEEANLEIKIMFAHPFEGASMNMERPDTLGVFIDGEKQDLTQTLKPFEVKLYSDETSFKGWQASYDIKRPGDYIFYVEPKPY